MLEEVAVRSEVGSKFLFVIWTEGNDSSTGVYILSGGISHIWWDEVEEVFVRSWERGARRGKRNRNARFQQHVDRLVGQ